VSGQVVDSDVEFRCERQGPMTAPVVSGRRRVVANFQGVEHRATGSAVIDMAIPQGAVSASTVSVIYSLCRWVKYFVLRTLRVRIIIIVVIRLVMDILFGFTSTETRMSMGSHSVTCHPTEATIPTLTPVEAGTRLRLLLQSIYN